MLKGNFWRFYLQTYEIFFFIIIYIIIIIFTYILFFVKPFVNFLHSRN